MRAESAIVVTVLVFVFLSFYFVILSLQATEDTFKRQLATLATFSLIAGVVLFASLMMHVGFKKAFSRLGEQLRSRRQQSKHAEN